MGNSGNMEEAQDAASRKDFIHCVTICLKEARETRYWLSLVKQANLSSGEDVDTLLQECVELVKILTAIVKRTKTS